ncbi:MAG TPA: metallopeptidase TldD-related protein [Acidimicrobiales bacterium]|jgi:predicted Zn-dependent protease|nr:metallopeptidase TldD-related protein [Acidimicrobiales bacterium]
MTTSQDLVEQALAASRSDSCVVVASDSTEANLRWANNTLTTNGVARGRTLTVISVSAGATGVVSRQGVSSKAALDALVAEADAAALAAAASGPAEDEAPLLGESASSGAWSDPPADASISVFDRFAPDLGASFQRASGSEQLLYGFASYDMTTTFVGASTGLRCRYDQPTGYLEINAKSADLARSTWAGVPSRDFTDLDMNAVHDDLERRLGWATRQLELPAGRYDTVLPPSAVADMMIYLYWSAEGRDAQEGRTVFSKAGGGTRVGDRLTDFGVTLRSDATAPGIECAPFLSARMSGGGQSVFDNGAPLAPTNWISNGVLSSLVQTRLSAGLTGLPFTPYVDNLILESADPAGDLDRLVASTERGLLLTCLWYIREVDPRTLLLTGLTRDGVYLVENGEVIGAVNNFRFNESPVDLLTRATAVGTTERTLPREWSDYFTRTAMPAMRIADFNMSSVSQAS